MPSLGTFRPVLHLFGGLKNRRQKGSHQKGEIVCLTLPHSTFFVPISDSTYVRYNLCCGRFGMFRDKDRYVSLHFAPISSSPNPPSPPPLSSPPPPQKLSFEECSLRLVWGHGGRCGGRMNNCLHCTKEENRRLCNLRMEKLLNRWNLFSWHFLAP